MKKLSFLFIPNWNGHLKLSLEKDISINYLYKTFNLEKSKIVRVFKNEMLKTNENIKKEYNKIVLDYLPFCICGDHSATNTLYLEFSKKFNDNSLVIFDAHPDCEKGFNSVSHEDYIRFLINKKIVSPKNIYIFGIRRFSRVEYEFLEKNKINYFLITELLKNTKKIERVLRGIKNDIYLSIDIDVLDIDFAPATYYREDCGLKINELLNFLKCIRKDKIKSIDICEFYKKFEDDKKTTEKNILKLIKFLRE